ncbi:MAG: DUF4124 domain-containing protein [Massilia sp.]
MTLALPAFRPASCALALLAALSAPAFAGGDIVKCVAADGHVTLTDQPCNAGSSSASVIVAAASAAPRAAVTKVALTPQVVEHDSWIDPKPHARMFSRDAATLRAARTSLQVMDEASASARQQRVAGLN